MEIVPKLSSAAGKADAGEFPKVLAANRHGDANAAQELLPLVYEELCKLAAQRAAKEPGIEGLPSLTGNVEADSHIRFVPVFRT